MTFDALAAGQSVFVDANVFLHYFTMHRRYGPACRKFLERIENRELTGFASSTVLAEVVHRLMTIEACQTFGWAAKGIARRLRRHPAQVQQLTRSRQNGPGGMVERPLTSFPKDLSHDHHCRSRLRKWRAKAETTARPARA